MSLADEIRLAERDAMTPRAEETVLASRFRARAGFSPGIALLLTSGIVFIIVVLMSITAFLDVRDQTRSAREAWIERGRLLANVGGDVLGAAVLSRNPDELGRLSAIMSRQPDVVYVNIYDGEGRHLIGPNRYEYPLTDTLYPEIIDRIRNLETIGAFQGSSFEVTSPVFVGATLVGAAVVGFSTDSLESRQAALAFDRVRLALVLVAGGILGSYLLSNFFAEPVRSLVRATHRIARRDLNARVGNLRGKEMRELGNSFDAMAAELQDMVGALEESRKRVVQREEAVRAEIARHLHGPVQGRLWALLAQLDDVRRGNGISPESAGRLEGISGEIDGVIRNELVPLTHELYPAIVRQGLVPALQSLCDRFEPGLDLTLQVPRALASEERLNRALLPEETRLYAYRITDEALTNAIKHAKGSRVDVRVEVSDGWLDLVIRDDGPGFDQTAEQHGVGLSNMHDYAWTIGGECLVTSAPGQGTTVFARLPTSEARRSNP